MRNITKIFILVFSLILLLAVSCSNDDKTGVKNNPPEYMEITDGETGGSGTGGSGTGGDSGTETGGGSGTGTGGDSGSGTGTGGSGEGGSGSGSGSGEGEGGTETGGETETTKTIDAKDFPTELLVRYKDDKLTSSGFSGYNFETEVSTITELGIQKTKIEGSWLKDGVTPPETSRQVVTIEKWKQTKKGGNPIKLEGESSDSGGGKYTIIYDYASGTLSGKYTHPDGTWSFSGTKK